MKNDFLTLAVFGIALWYLHKTQTAEANAVAADAQAAANELATNASNIDFGV